MDRWKYKYSFFCGILFILSFLSKELIKFSRVELSNILILGPYLLMVIYNLGLYLGFIKYGKLNDKKPLLWSSILVILSYSILIFIELFSNIGQIEVGSSLIKLTKNFASISLMLFAICLFLRKKIYGKSTLLAAGLTFLFSFSLIIPFTQIVGIVQLPVFLLSYALLTYVVNKNENKMKKKQPTPRFLKNRF